MDLSQGFIFPGITTRVVFGAGTLAQTRDGAPLALRDLGLTPEDPDRAAAIAVQTPYPNPRPFDRADIRKLLQAAWEGTRPA